MFVDAGFTKTSKQQVLTRMMGCLNRRELKAVLRKNPALKTKYNELSELSKFRNLLVRMCEEYGMIVIEIPGTECRDLYFAEVDDLTDEGYHLLEQLKTIGMFAYNG